MEGWHTTGTALFPLLRRIAPSSASVSSRISNLQYPSKWNVRLDLADHTMCDDVPSIRKFDICHGGLFDGLRRPTISRKRKTFSRSLLRRLNEIDASTARFYTLKDLVQRQFKMRLLMLDAENGHPERLDPSGSRTMDRSALEPSSYIALSYCWHYTSWKTSTILSGLHPSADSKSSLPVTVPMWKAFLAERLDSSEAFWVDQGCIEQGDPSEKLYAINSMDTVFGNARKVVVALEDIDLTA